MSDLNMFLYRCSSYLIFGKHVYSKYFETKGVEVEKYEYFVHI